MDPRLVLTVLCSAAELFAFVRFVRARAHRVLPWFSAYLLAGFAQSFVWLAGPPRSHAYATVYGLTTPLVVGLQIGVFIELWRKLMARHSEADKAARTLNLAIIFVSIALSLLTGADGLRLHLGLSRQTLFIWIFWSVRYTATVLCIACSLLALSVSIHGERLPRYVTRHAHLLALYFGLIAAGYLTYNLKLLPSALMGALTVGAVTGAYVLWGLLIPGYIEGECYDQAAAHEPPQSTTRIERPVSRPA